MTAGRVLFVGCGPGAADLLTLRAVAAIESADIVIWSPSLIDRDVLTERMRPEAEMLTWPPMTQREILEVYDRAIAEGLLVVRLKGGDPALFGGLEPELTAARERGLDCEIVPGISALSAVAAALGRELATPDATLLLADAAGLPDAEHAASAIAVHGAGAAPRELQRELEDRGLPAGTPCAVAIEVSRADETLIPCVLEELAETLEDMSRGLLTIVLVAPVADGSETVRSR